MSFGRDHLPNDLPLIGRIRPWSLLTLISFCTAFSWRRDRIVFPHPLRIDCCLPECAISLEELLREVVLFLSDIEWRALRSLCLPLSWEFLSLCSFAFRLPKSAAALCWFEKLYLPFAFSIASKEKGLYCSSLGVFSIGIIFSTEFAQCSRGSSTFISGADFKLDIAHLHLSCKALSLILFS